MADGIAIVVEKGPPPVLGVSSPERRALFVLVRAFSGLVSTLLYPVSALMGLVSV